MLGIQSLLCCLSAGLALAGSLVAAGLPPDSLTAERRILSVPQPDISRRAVSDLRSLLLNPKQKWCSNTQIFFPSQPNYANLTTQRWSSYEEPSYLASVKPGCEQDVVTIVKLCVANYVPFLATGGGHSFSINLGNIKNGLELDMSGFKTVKVDAAANTVTIGGAVTIGEILDPLYAASKEMPTGSCPCVGVVGATMGAGVGRYQGIHGLMIDNLLSVRLVTAAGDIITASATQNADLFWGFRGAGMNFGVVTSAVYKVHDLTNGGQVQDADLVFVAPQNASYFDVLSSMTGNLPPELSLITFTAYNATFGQPVIILNAVYPGPMDKFKSLIKPFLDLQPVVQVIHTLPWNRLVPEATFSVMSQVCIKGTPQSRFAAGVKTMPAAPAVRMFASYAAMYDKYPETRGSSFEIESFANQAVLAVPDDATAYPWRDFNAHIMVGMSFPDGPDSEAGKYANSLGVQIRDDFVKTSGYGGLEVYVSYAHGDEDPRSTFGASKLPRLVKLKNQWDPKNVFGYDKPIPLKWP